MSDKMQVLFVKQTGHVLAAFTRTADPEGKPEVSSLAGSGLLVRNRTIVSGTPSGGETLVAPSDSLDVAVVDYDPDVFNDPRSFVAGGGKVAALGLSSIQLALVTDPIPPPPPALVPTVTTP